MTDDLRTTLSVVAGADLSSDEGRLMRFVSATGNRITVSRVTDGTIAGGQFGLGVLVDGVANGANGTLRMFGIIDNAKAGGVLTPGTHFALASDAAGRFVAAADGDRIYGYFLGKRAAAANEKIQVLLTFGHEFNSSTGDIIGALGAVDNVLVRSNGAGGQTVQGSDAVMDDNEVLTVNNATGGVTFGAAAQTAGAVIESVSTTRGWLPSRMTTAQFAAINGAAPPEGLLAYDTDINTLTFQDDAAVRWIPRGPSASTDNAFVRFDGITGAIQSTANATLTDAGAATFAQGVTCTAGGLTVTAGGLTVTAGGATITAGDLVVTAGNITMSAGGATVDGLDLDTAIRGALGANDNDLCRVDGAGGVTAQGSGGNATLTDAGALTLAQGLTCTAGGLTVTAGGVTVTAGGVAVNGGNLDVAAGNITVSGTVDGQDLAATLGNMRSVTLTPGAEAGDTIAVVINVVDLTGAAVNAVTRLVCHAHTVNAANDVTLTETGAGAVVAVSAAHESAMIIVDTDANGDATVSVNCAAVGAVCFSCTPLAASGATYWGFGRSTDLNFA